MSVQQLCFFKFQRPLVDLLGVDFFRTAPAKPGVYVFLGEARRVLYVGQSQNLRSRLAYYKNAQPEREPRRIIRMVHQTRAIELQLCESAAEAQAREVELIQEHRPRFNVQHALSRTYSFFTLREEGPALRLGLSMHEPLAADETIVGAFKNRGLCRRALFAVGRTAWSRAHAPREIFDLPISAMDRSRVNELRLEAHGEIRDPLLNLLRGTESEFLRQTEALVQKAGDQFLRKVFESDLQTLAEFFELAVRMRSLRERSGTTEILPQCQVDRVATRARHQKPARSGDDPVANCIQSPSG
jgi:excinuclease UvrABC nuclease subunit